jgi:head-tail adaptor
MRAGKLDHTLIFERATATIDGNGVAVETWAQFVTLRAEIVTQRADEAQREQGASTEVTTTYRTRFYPGITVADRVSDGTRLHNIVAVTEIGRRRELELRTVARGAA